LRRPSGENRAPVRDSLTMPTRVLVKSAMKLPRAVFAVGENINAGGFLHFERN
jgi:hypothetical protein